MLVPPSMTLGEVILYLVVGLGGSLLLRSLLPFPWYLLPLLALVVYSSIRVLREPEDESPAEDDHPIS
jgi:hypothetical protein